MLQEACTRGAGTITTRCLRAQWKCCHTRRWSTSQHQRQHHQRRHVCACALLLLVECTRWRSTRLVACGAGETTHTDSWASDQKAPLADRPLCLRFHGKRPRSLLAGLTARFSRTRRSCSRSASGSTINWATEQRRTKASRSLWMRSADWTRVAAAPSSKWRAGAGTQQVRSARCLVLAVHVCVHSPPA